LKYTAETMLVKSMDTGGSGEFAHVRAEEAGWDYLNMSAYRMNKSEKHSDNTGEYENVIVILGGRCTIRTEDGVFENIGRRPNVFSGMPYALYMSRNKAFEVEALTDNFEIAECWVKTDEDHPTQ
jgi:5-deoxy-glucuronate isomerase